MFAAFEFPTDAFETPAAQPRSPMGWRIPGGGAGAARGNEAILKGPIDPYGVLPVRWGRRRGSGTSNYRGPASSRAKGWRPAVAPHTSERTTNSRARARFSIVVASGVKSPTPRSGPSLATKHPFSRSRLLIDCGGFKSAALGCGSLSNRVCPKARKNSVDGEGGGQSNMIGKLVWRSVVPELIARVTFSFQSHT